MADPQAAASPTNPHRTKTAATPSSQVGTRRPNTRDDPSEEIGGREAVAVLFPVELDGPL